jgi:hypothetical protein
MGSVAEWAAVLLILSLGCGGKTGSAAADAGGGVDAPAVSDDARSDGTTASQDTGTTGPDSAPDMSLGGSDAGSDVGPACSSGTLGAACAGAGGCCSGLMCISLGGEQAHCCVPVGGSCSKPSDCCGEMLDCVNGTCCGVTQLFCSATSCCPGYYCNPGNYCAPSPDAGSGG